MPSELLVKQTTHKNFITKKNKNMKKLFLSLTLAITMILINTIESKAIGFSLEYKLGEWCKTAGDVCIIKIEFIKMPNATNQNTNFIVPATCLNKDFSAEKMMYVPNGMSYTYLLNGVTYYLNIEPVNAVYTDNKTYNFTINYSSSPKYKLIK